MKNIHFGRSILNGQDWKDVPTDEVLAAAKTLLADWMDNQHSLERPKLYDHYALVFVALIEKVSQLEQELNTLKVRT